MAVKKEDGQRLYIGDFETPKIALADVELACQDCGSPMIIKAGDIVRAHFAHARGYENEECWFRSNPESEIHLNAKQMIANAIKKAWPNATIDIEHRIETPAGRRYIDVFVELPDGRKFAHEAQVSNQSIERFRERTEAYLSDELIPVWWLGGAANSKENQSWVRSNSYYLGFIGIESYERTLIDERYAYSDTDPYGA